MDVYKRHRFCLVMENSLSHDYVSEKLWDAFAGGCVPVYYVCPNPNLAQVIVKLATSFQLYGCIFGFLPCAGRTEVLAIIYCPALGVGCDAKQPQRQTLQVFLYISLSVSFSTQILHGRP